MLLLLLRSVSGKRVSLLSRYRELQYNYLRKTSVKSSISPRISSCMLVIFASTNQTHSIGQKFNSQDQGTLQPPRVVGRLCSNQGEQEFVTQEGQQHTFYKSAASAQRCDAGKIWKVAENGAEVPDATTFYFDGSGMLLDVCQPLFWRSGCQRFEHLSCEEKNYCKE